jgi:hypothetical protein
MRSAQRFETRGTRRALAVARAWLDAEDDHRPLVVTGPAGIGKSVVLSGIADFLVRQEGGAVVSGSLDDARAARHFADRARSLMGRSEPDTRVVLVADGTERLPAAERESVLAMASGHARTRIVATADRAGQIRGALTLTVQPLEGPGAGAAGTVEPLQSSESVRFFLHCLRQRNPAAELLRADHGTVARICGSSFGIPAELEVLAELVDRHGLCDAS